jgi:hypothetical protein
MAAEDAAVCVACRIPFRIRDAGFLGCRIHPLTLNPDTGHFDCCGAAPSGSPCAAHAERRSDLVSGCHAIDHCASLEERVRILTERPYVVGPLDQAIAQMPFAAEADGVRVFHMVREDQLDDEKFSVPVSKMWQGLASKGRLRVNLHEEHRMLREAIVAREYESGRASTDMVAAANDLSDPYASEWVRHVAGVRDITTPAFVPFVIVMRIGSACEYTRGVEKTSCVWRD